MNFVNGGQQRERAPVEPCHDCFQHFRMPVELDQVNLKAGICLGVASIRRSHLEQKCSRRQLTSECDLFLWNLYAPLVLPTRRPQLGLRAHRLAVFHSFSVSGVCFTTCSVSLSGLVS